MSETIESYSLAGRDAATLEREERLAKAKRKLKSYRAKQAKSSSTASSMDPLSRPTSAASGSTNVHRRSISKSNILNPIASTSKGVAVAGHGRKASNSRANRNSFTHSHTRSKASISISVSAPMNYEEPEDFNPFATNNYNNNSDFSTPSSDNPYATIYKPNRNSWKSQTPSNPSPLSRDDASTSTSYKRLSNSLDPRTAAITRSPSPSPSTAPFPLLTAESKAHNRKSSRHSRRLSITNFRDSMEIVSGQGNYSGVLTPTIGSFAPLPTSSSNPYDVSPHRSPPTPGWSNDPIKVLEALKERGRLETEEENDQKRTRMGALEALEGRLSAPSEMIDLGNEEEGQLLHAPPSPGYTTTSAPTSPTPVFSPMYGLGLVGGSTPVAVKRNSWNALGPVTAAGAKGALDLGMLIEEEEEEEEVQEPEQIDPLSTVASPPRKAKASPRRRPSSLSLSAPLESISSIAISSPIDETPTSSTFAARPMRLSMSLSSSTSSIGLTPSTSASTFPERPAPPLRSLTLGSVPLSAPLSREPSHESVSPNERRRSLLYTSSSSTTTSPALPAARGLRPLSIGSFSPSVISPSPTEPKQRSPVSSRSSLPPSSYHHPNNSITNTNSATSTPSNRNPTPSASKRSSISYRTSSVASLASSEGPLSASAQAARRPWRTSFSGTSISSTSSTPGPTASSSAPLTAAPFSFSNSHGSFGGFGDLSVDDTEIATTGEEGQEDVDDDLVNQRIRELFGRSSMDEAAKAALVLETLNTQITTLQFQLEQVNLSLESSTTRHGIEMEEFEKRAGEEARGMRMRISELEKSIEETSIVRRFEVEGLTREAEQAKEAMEDLVEERDSLREDVDGWRNRCAQLEKVVKKDKEDEALSNAQIKLIGEMRDQIYNLVATLDRERIDHEETKAVVERLLIERAPSPPSEEDTFEELPAIGSRGGQDLSNNLHHAFKAASDTSVISTNSVGRSLSGNTTEATSIGTDSEDNNHGFSKSTSPTSSAHSSFPNSTSSIKSQSHDNDFANAVAIGGLQTLAEEEEEEEVEKVASLPLVVAIPERERDIDRIRSGSGSTGSTAESEAMPMTPSKESMNHHNRSDSFVRHWSFPKGSVSSVRMSVDEDHSFFDLNRHTSLPALPIPESILPPFLCADLMVDEEQFATFASTSLPASASAPSLRGPFPTPPPRLLPTPPPRNQNRLSAQPMRSPTQERLSPQQPIRRAPIPPQIQTRNIPPPPRPSSASNSRPPPVSPSALHHQSAFGGSQASSNGSISLNSPSRLARLSQLSLTGIVTSLGGWSPSSSVSAVASAVTNSTGRLSMSTTREDEEERMFTAQSKQQQQVHKTPSSLAYESRSPQKFIHHDQQPRPLASRLRVLDFRPVCCSSENTPLFNL